LLKNFNLIAMKNLLLLTCLLLFQNVYSQRIQQNIRGTVRDDISGIPLPGANVQVLGTDEFETKGASTNESGYFVLQDVKTGRRILKITLLGYEDRLLTDIVLTGGKEVVLNVTLTESIIELDELAVRADRSADKGLTANDLVLASGRSFNIDDTKRYAGSLGDPSRMAANFAGVASGNDARNDIVVRGNSPSGMLWQLEGLNIPNPNHFGSYFATGGPVSMLNNNVLAKSDFITSAFPAQYGDALAAVFDLRLREGNPQKREMVGQIGFNGFELGAEGPFSGRSSASYLINYRYSTLGVFKALGIKVGTGTSTPDYQDLNFKLATPVGKNGKLSLFGIAGSSNAKFLGNETDTTLNDMYGSENANVFARYATNVFGLSFEQSLSKRSNLRFALGRSATRERVTADSISLDTREEFPSDDTRYETEKYSFVTTFRHKFSSKTSLSAGVTTDALSFDFYNRTIHQGGTVDSIRIDESGKHTLLTQAYAQTKHRFSPKWVFTAGLHLQHLGLNRKTALEPRAALQYHVGRNQTLAVSYGMHSQSQNIYSYFVRTATPTGNQLTNKNLDFTKSYHFVASYEHRLSENLLLKIEPYYQALYNAPIERNASSFSSLNVGATFGPNDRDSLVNEGTGRNMGVELTLERYFSGSYYFLFTASLFDSNYKGSDGVTRNTAFNTRYLMNALAGKEFKILKTNVVGINFKTTLVGGRYFTPIDVLASRRLGHVVFDDARAFSEKQTPYFRTDLKFSYRWEMGKSTMEFALDLQNVTAHKNVFQQMYNPRTDSIVKQYGQGFFPIPYFRATF
jgi:hypothetical protein